MRLHQFQFAIIGASIRFSQDQTADLSMTDRLSHVDWQTFRIEQSKILGMLFQPSRFDSIGSSGAADPPSPAKMVVMP